MAMVSIGTHDEDRGLQAELQLVQAAYPRVWEYIQNLQRSESPSNELPRFDDNDEVIKQGGSHNEGIS